MDLPEDLLKIVQEKREFCGVTNKLFQEVPKQWRTVAIKHRLFDLFSYNMDTIQWLVNHDQHDIVDWLYQNYWRE